MLLTIDVGNTNMVFAIFRGEEMIGSFRLRTDGQATSDEIGLMASEYFLRFGLEPKQVEDVVIASVVPQVMYSLTSACIKYFAHAPLVVGTDLIPQLPYAIETKEHLGADRAVACVAAIEKYGAPVIVIDFGTATTIDAISAKGVYLGGTIGTGLRVTMDALTARAAMLPRVELAMPRQALGMSTVTQMQAGVVAGYVGNIDYLVSRIRREMNEPYAHVVATGGLSKLVAQETDCIDIQDSFLILDGLRAMYRRRQEA